MDFKLSQQKSKTLEIIVALSLLIFISTIGYFYAKNWASNSRNAKRVSDLQNIEIAIKWNLATGKNIVLYVKNDNNNDSRIANISLAWSTPAVWIEYEAGHVDYKAIWMDIVKNNAPLTDIPYIIGITSRLKWKYQIATSMETWFTKEVKIQWNYTPRKNIKVLGVGHQWASLFVLSNSFDIDKFAVGDTIFGNHIITSIMRNGLNLITNSPFIHEESSIALASVESYGLIDKYDSPPTSWDNTVIDGWNLNFPDSLGY